MRAQRKDANHAAIVKAYRDRGCSVQNMPVGSGFDLLVGSRGISDLVEVKDGAKPPSGRVFTPAETKLHQSWRGSPVVVVLSEGDVARHVEDMHRRAQWVADGRVECDIPRRYLQ